MRSSIRVCTARLPSVVGTIQAIAFFAVALLLIFYPKLAFAQAGNGPVIFDVRRSLPLEPEEPVYHDFYISAGPEAGFKKGAYVTVVRPVPVHDPIQNKQQATLNITIGKLQIIQAERGISVGRLYSEAGDEERPTVEFEAVMIGDRVDMASITMDEPKKKEQKKRGLFGKKTEAPAAQPSEQVEVKVHETSSASEAPQAAAPPAPAVQRTDSASQGAAAGSMVAPMSAPASVQPTRPATVPSLESGPTARGEFAPEEDSNEDSRDRNSFPTHRSSGTVRLASEAMRDEWNDDY